MRCRHALVGAEQYIGLIKAMRVLDPSGALIESAGAPVRQYLRTSRPDTIRCLVSMLTGEVSEGEGLDSLQEELTRPVKDESDGEDADNDAAVSGARQVVF